MDKKIVNGHLTFTKKELSLTHFLPFFRPILDRLKLVGHKIFSQSLHFSILQNDEKLLSLLFFSSTFHPFCFLSPYQTNPKTGANLRKYKHYQAILTTFTLIPSPLCKAHNSVSTLAAMTNPHCVGFTTPRPMSVGKAYGYYLQAQLPEIGLDW